MIKIVKNPGNKNTEFNDALKTDHDEESNHDIVEIVNEEFTTGDTKF